MSDWDEIIRRKRDGIISETVHRWHNGPGSPGGRTYGVLYGPTGRIRIDVSGAWASEYHTVWLEPEELRPAGQWQAHLAKTGVRPPRQPRWCDDCGTEIPEDRERFCSIECSIEARQADAW